MKRIYCFEKNIPPALSEKKLRVELEKRRLRRQVVILAVSGMLTVWCLLAFAFLLRPINIALSISYFAYASVAICGGSAITIIFVDKGRNIE